MIYEDNELLRTGLSDFLSTDSEIEIVGAYADANNVVADIESLMPNVVLMDIGMPGTTGIEAVKKIKEKSPSPEILMLTGFDDDKNIFESITAGASGYLLKKTSPKNIIEAVKDAHSGGAPMTSSVAKQVLQLFVGKPVTGSNDFLLTPKEKEVLNLLVNGFSYKMIASEMAISIETVRSHIKHIYEKLHVNSKSEAVALALKQRIV